MQLIHFIVAVLSRVWFTGLILANLSFVLTDIEKNPGPSFYVDATKTIHAPYCQESVVLFGENAGQQCVAMSLRALIYSKITRISSVDDMIQIWLLVVNYILVCHCKTVYVNVNRIARNGYSVLRDFSSLNTVKVVLVTCMVMPELRGITTVCYPVSGPGIGQLTQLTTRTT